MSVLKQSDLKIETLGERKFVSPLMCRNGGAACRFVPEHAKVRHLIEIFDEQSKGEEVFFERSGAREKIFFDPQRTRAAVVTCGGLSPGLNNVVRSIYRELTSNYGVRDVLGIRYGYHGFLSDTPHRPVKLSEEFVSNIHVHGGSVLGSSRGEIKAEAILDFLQREEINLLFCIGGDGTQRGAMAIGAEAKRRNYPAAVVGIPKTIDNDVPYVWRSFGFLTAIEKGSGVIEAAKIEAEGAVNGISIVKLMGREAGFITANAALASQCTDVVLVPEIPFKLEGYNGLLNYIAQGIEKKGHLVIAAAEGAGQDLFPEQSTEKDASGNKRFQDVGLLLKDSIQKFFAAKGKTVNIRYFDPSYYIRSVRANCEDSMVCDEFGRHAVHAAMAGYTNVVIGRWYNVMIYVPMELVTTSVKRMSPTSELWRSVLETTGQPASFC